MFNLRQIEVFRAVMSAGSVTAAAQRLNLSQPSVSRLLGQIEAAFGCPLFVRGSRGVTPTPEAVQFFHEVERIYGVLTTLEDVARDIALFRRGILSFGTIAAFAFTVVPRALARIGAGEGNISINWRIRDSRQLIERALHGHLSLGLAYVTSELEGLRVIARFSSLHMALLPAGHRLALGGGPLTLSDLDNERVVALTGVTTETMQQRLVGQARWQPITVETSYAAASLASALGVIGIVDPLSAEWFARDGQIVARPISDMAPYEVALFEPAAERESQLSKSFQAVLVEEIDRVIGSRQPRPFGA